MSPAGLNVRCTARFYIGSPKIAERGAKHLYKRTFPIYEIDICLILTGKSTQTDDIKQMKVKISNILFIITNLSEFEANKNSLFCPIRKP